MLTCLTKPNSNQQQVVARSHVLTRRILSEVSGLTDYLQQLKMQREVGFPGHLSAVASLEAAVALPSLGQHKAIAAPSAAVAAVAVVVSAGPLPQGAGEAVVAVAGAAQLQPDPARSGGKRHSSVVAITGVAATAASLETIFAGSKTSSDGVMQQQHFPQVIDIPVSQSCQVPKALRCSLQQTRG